MNFFLYGTTLVRGCFPEYRAINEEDILVSDIELVIRCSPRS